MSIPIETLILLPTDRMRIYCTDGMTNREVELIKRVFNFGVNVEFYKCGGKLIDGFLLRSYYTMWMAANDETSTSIKNELHLASNENYQAYLRWHETALYR